MNLFHLSSLSLLREWRKRTTALFSLILVFKFEFDFWFIYLLVCISRVMAQSHEATPNLVLQISIFKFVLSWLLPNRTRVRAALFTAHSSNARFQNMSPFTRGDLQSSNFCSKTPWRLVGARATREGGVLQLKLISQIVSDFWFIPLFDCTICHVWCICSNLT